MQKKIQLFTPGPVNINKSIRDLASQQQPYFRTSEFSEFLIDLEKRLLRMIKAPEGYRAIFAVGSGTSAMQASIGQLKDSTNTLISVETGLFGERASQIAELIGSGVSRIKMLMTESPDKILAKLLGEPELENTIVHLTLADTSTGYFIDPSIVKKIRETGCIILADGVTSLFTDPINVENFDILYSASHKGIACNAGVAYFIISPRAQALIKNKINPCFYFDLAKYLHNGERGQPPFTPNSLVLTEMSQRLTLIEETGGYDAHINTIEKRAMKFRKFISQFKFETSTPHHSNCITCFRPELKISAAELTKKLAKKNIYVTPNSASCFPDYLRVAHFGDQDDFSYDCLFKELSKLCLMYT